MDKTVHVAIGLSGGSDSMALLFLMKEVAEQNTNIKITAITINHNLRKESLEEAKQISRMLLQHGVEHKILHWRHAGIESNIQHNARDARLNLLTSYCKENKLNYLFLGHTQDDVAENYMIRSLRGSGVYGLASISSSTVLNGVEIIRPCLTFSKKILQKYLIDKSIEWIEDPSNENTQFFRVNIRKLLHCKEATSLFNDRDLISSRLALSAKNLARTRSFVEEEVKKAKEKIARLFPEGYIVLDNNEFSTLHEEIALQLLALCLMKVSVVNYYKPRLESLERLYNVILTKPKFTHTLSMCEIKKKGDCIYIYRETPKYGYTIKKQSNNSWIWDHRFLIKTKDNTEIKNITNCTNKKIASYDIVNCHNIPKKIWYSLPQIILKNNQSFVPFLDILPQGITVSFLTESI